MNSTQIRFVGAVCFVLAFLFAFRAGGWQQKTSYPESVTFTCHDETVKVVPTDGTDPKALYLCTGTKLTFDPNNHKFTAKFRKSPFVGGETTFDNDHLTSTAKKVENKLIVYQFDMTVDGVVVNDPQVIGGGGH